MNTRERAERNQAIVEARFLGVSCEAVARRYGITPRQVRRVCAEGADYLPGGWFQEPELSDEAADEAMRQVLSEASGGNPSRGLADLRRQVRAVGERSRILARSLGPLR